MPETHPVKKRILPPLVLALAAAGATLRAQDIDPLKPPDPTPPALDAKTAELVRALRPPVDTRLSAIADSLQPSEVEVKISLSEHRLQVFARGEVAVECAIAHGRAISATPEGEFRVESKTTEAKGLTYGHVRRADGSILIRGVFGKIDPLPADTTFDPVTPKCAFKLSGDGPLLIAGEATGAGTTDGTVVIPDKIALFLYDKLAPGVKVVIE